MMSRAFEEFYNDGVKRAEIRAEKRGIEREKKETTRNLLLMGMPHEKIAKVVNLSLERIREIEAECKND